jgi:hypothetical protein
MFQNMYAYADQPRAAESSDREVRHINEAPDPSLPMPGVWPGDAHAVEPVELCGARARD